MKHRNSFHKITWIYREPVKSCSRIGDSFIFFFRTRCKVHPSIYILFSCNDYMLSKLYVYIQGKVLCFFLLSTQHIFLQNQSIHRTPKQEPHSIVGRKTSTQKKHTNTRSKENKTSITMLHEKIRNKYMYIDTSKNNCTRAITCNI
jgi:hypothetical protein